MINPTWQLVLASQTTQHPLARWFNVSSHPWEEERPAGGLQGVSVCANEAAELWSRHSWPRHHGCFHTGTRHWW